MYILNFFREVIKLPSSKPEKKSEPVKITVKETSNYVTLVKALSVDWSKPDNAKKISKMDYSYFLMRGKLNF